MLSERWLSSLVVVAVVVITAGYFMVADPEAASVTSQDGMVTVTGLARQTQPLQVAVASTVAAPLFGSAYTITPDGVTLDEPVTVAFKVLDSDQPRALLGVYYFHPTFEMWEPVAPVVADTHDTIAVATAQLGTFAVGSVPSFAAPVFADVYDDLRAKAPPNAVGYDTAVAFTQADHELVRLQSLGENGGCGGAVRVGDGESVSRLERAATVDIDGQPTTLTFVFVTRWFTSSTGGCAQTEPLRPLSEYDILDDIKP